jgi:hypothetical protein
MAALRSLVLPFGASTGRRIVLDGVNGVEQIYDASDILVAQLDDTGLQVFAAVAPGAYIKLTPAGMFGGTEIDLQPANVVGVTYEPGLLTAEDDGTAEKRPQLLLEGPNISGKNFPDMIMLGQGVTDNDYSTKFDATRFELFNTTGSVATDFVIDGVSQGRGFRFTTALTTTQTTGVQAMSLSAATNFVWRKGRCYKVSLRGRYSTSVTNDLFIPKLLRGTTTAASVVLDFGGIPGLAGGAAIPVDISAYIKNATGADITQTVQMSIQCSNAANTCSWNGGTVPRSMTIEDVGAAADYGATANDI